MYFSPTCYCLNYVEEVCVMTDKQREEEVENICDSNTWNHNENAKSICKSLSIKKILNTCNIDIVNARDPNAYEIYIDHIKNNKPIYISRKNYDGKSNIELNKILSSAKNIQVSATTASAIPRRENMNFKDFLHGVVQSEKNVVSAILNNKTSLLKNEKLAYIFPGPRPNELFNKLSAIFNDTRRVFGGRLVYDHAHGGSAVSFNGRFMGLPFHFHTSVLHEVIAGAKHFFFYTDKPPPFGVRSTNNDNQNISMTEWVAETTDEQYFESSSLKPNYQCTVLPGDIIFVPYNVTHGTFNLAPTLSLIRSGCNGMVPSISVEILKPQCDGPDPPIGKNAWGYQDFVKEPIRDRRSRKFPDLLKIKMNLLSGTRFNRDMRVKFIIFANSKTKKGVKMLNSLNKIAKEYSSSYNPPYVFVHVPFHCKQDGDGPSCGNLYVDGRAIDLGETVIDLGYGVSKKKIKTFLQKHANQLKLLKSLLRTDIAS